MVEGGSLTCCDIVCDVELLSIDIGKDPNRDDGNTKQKEQRVDY